MLNDQTTIFNAFETTLNTSKYRFKYLCIRQKKNYNQKKIKMKTRENLLSPTRLKRLRAQGYTSESNLTLSKMAFGIRFPYRVCVTLVITAIITQSIGLFIFMLGMSLLAILLPNHPFDYVYNLIISKWMKRPQVPPRSLQLKFACTIATLWLAAIVILLAGGQESTALVLAGLLAFVALLPSTIDYCVPSVIYNYLFLKKGQKEMHSSR